MHLSVKQSGWEKLECVVLRVDLNFSVGTTSSGKYQSGALMDDGYNFLSLRLKLLWPSLNQVLGLAWRVKRLLIYHIKAKKNLNETGA